MLPAQIQGLQKRNVLFEFTCGELVQQGVLDHAKVRTLYIYSSRQVEVTNQFGTTLILAHNLDWSFLTSCSTIKKDMYFTLKQQSDQTYTLTMLPRMCGGGNGTSSSKGSKNSIGSSLSTEERNRISQYLKEKDINVALHRAIYAEDAEATLILLKLGANPNSIGSKQSNFIEALLFLPDPQVIQAMVRLGADVNALNKDGVSAFADVFNRVSYSKEYRKFDLQTVELMLKAGGDPNAKVDNEPLLLIAIKAGGEDLKYKLIRLLIENGAEINIADPVYDTVFFRLFSLLNSAYAATHPEVTEEVKDLVKLFIDRGVDLKVLDQHGRGVLVRCLDAKWTDLFMLALEKGANYHEKDRIYGSFFVSVISYFCVSEAVEALTRKGADLAPCQTKDYKTVVPLIRILYQGWTHLVPLFLERGAKVDIKDEVFSLQCLEAAVLHCPDAIEMLISAGACFNELEGSQPIAYLLTKNWSSQGERRTDFKEKITLFQKYGMDINKASQEGLNALALVLKHYLEKQDPEKKGFHSHRALKDLSILLECGADPLLISANLLLGAPDSIQALLFQGVIAPIAKLDSLTLKVLTGIDPSANTGLKQLAKQDALKETIKKLLIENHMALIFANADDQTLILQNTFIKELTVQLNQLLNSEFYLNVENQTYNQEAIINSLQETITTWKAVQRQSIAPK